MTPSNAFKHGVIDLLEQIATQSADSLDAAASVLADVIARDGIIHIGGAGGHSQIPAMEMFYRAGGLANVSVMFPPGLGLFDGKPCLERVEGMGGATIAYHDVRAQDVVIVVNYYGMNAATIDLALAAKRRKVNVIGITSRAFASNTPQDFCARHSSAKNLADIADIVIDTHTSVEEQLISLPGVTQPVGVASSIAGCFVVQLLNIRTAEECVARGITPPLWMCANLPGGDQANHAFLQKYMPRMRHLYPEGDSYVGI